MIGGYCAPFDLAACFLLGGGVLIALAILLGCCCLCYFYRARLFGRYDAPERNAFFQRGIALATYKE